MRTKNLTGGTLSLALPTRYRVGRIQFWKRMLRLYQSVPGDLCPFTTIAEAKMQTAALCVFFSCIFPFLLIPGIVLLREAKKGGA